MRRVLTPALIFAGMIVATASAAAPASSPQHKSVRPVLRAATGVGVAASAKKPAAHAAAPAVSAKQTVAKAKNPAPRPAVAMIKPTPAVHKKAVFHKLASKTHRMQKHFAMRRHGTAISIPMDEVRVVAFSQPVQTVYVGNPLIADVTMIDSRHAFLLGKGFGATNIIALNSDGKQVVSDTVSVFGHTGNLVILHRGAAQATYACAGSRCEIAPTPGDDKEYYSGRMDQLTSHQDAGLKAAAAGR
jgi:Flp pilus assembly secretin CpaC